MIELYCYLHRQIFIQLQHSLSLFICSPMLIPLHFVLKDRKLEIPLDRLNILYEGERRNNPKADNKDMMRIFHFIDK